MILAKLIVSSDLVLACTQASWLERVIYKEIMVPDIASVSRKGSTDPCTLPQPLS